MHLLLLEEALSDGKLSAESQGEGIRLKGSAEAESLAEDALSAFEMILAKNSDAGVAALEGAIEQARAPSQTYGSLTGLKTLIKPQTNRQAQYLDLLTGTKNDLIFGVGPAGTGKTFLAVAAGAAALKNKSAARLIITRPAVEAGILASCQGIWKKRSNPTCARSGMRWMKRSAQIKRCGCGRRRLSRLPRSPLCVDAR